MTQPNTPERVEGRTLEDRLRDAMLRFFSPGHYPSMDPLEFVRVVEEAANALAEKDAEIGRLREALEPFADNAERYAIAEANGEKHFPDSHWVYTDLGDLRRARATLNDKSEENFNG